MDMFLQENQSFQDSLLYINNTYEKKKALKDKIDSLRLSGKSVDKKLLLQYEEIKERLVLLKISKYDTVFDALADCVKMLDAHISALGERIVGNLNRTSAMLSQGSWVESEMLELLEFVKEDYLSFEKVQNGLKSAIEADYQGGITYFTELSDIVAERMQSTMDKIDSLQPHTKAFGDSVYEFFNECYEEYGQDFVWELNEKLKEIDNNLVVEVDLEEDYDDADIPTND